MSCVMEVSAEKPSPIMPLCFLSIMMFSNGCDASNCAANILEPAFLHFAVIHDKHHDLLTEAGPRGWRTYMHTCPFVHLRCSLRCCQCYGCCGRVSLLGSYTRTIIFVDSRTVSRSKTIETRY